MDLQDADYGNTEPEEHVLDANEPYPVVISPFHFILLSLATLGMYNIWWQFKCWRYFRQKENPDSLLGPPNYGQFTADIWSAFT